MPDNDKVTYAAGPQADVWRESNERWELVERHVEETNADPSLGASGAHKLEKDGSCTCGYTYQDGRAEAERQEVLVDRHVDYEDREQEFGLDHRPADHHQQHDGTCSCGYTGRDGLTEAAREEQAVQQHVDEMDRWSLEAVNLAALAGVEHDPNEPHRLQSDGSCECGYTYRDALIEERDDWESKNEALTERHLNQMDDRPILERISGEHHEMRPDGTCICEPMEATIMSLDIDDDEPVGATITMTPDAPEPTIMALDIDDEEHVELEATLMQFSDRSEPEPPDPDMMLMPFEPADSHASEPEPMTSYDAAPAMQAAMAEPAMSESESAEAGPVAAAPQAQVVEATAMEPMSTSEPEPEPSESFAVATQQTIVEPMSEPEPEPEAVVAPAPQAMYQAEAVMEPEPEPDPFFSYDAAPALQTVDADEDTQAAPGLI
jgi:hypothetical protein